jgi:hypothetical protein
MAAIHSRLLVVFDTEIKRGLEVLKSRAKKHSRMLAQVAKLLDEGKAEEAEKQFLPTYAELTAMGCWFLDPRRGAMDDFDDTYARLVEELGKSNRAEAQSVIKQLRDKTRPELTKFAETIENNNPKLRRNHRMERQNSIGSEAIRRRL